MNPERQEYLPYPEPEDGRQDEGGYPEPDLDEPQRDDDDGRPDR